MLTRSRQKPKRQTTSNSAICLQKNTREKANKSGQRRTAVLVSEDQATETDKGQAGTLPREQAGEKTAGEPWTVQRAAQQWAGVTLWPKYCGWLQVNSGVTDWKVRPGRWWGEVKESYWEGEATDGQIVTDRVSHTWSVLRMQIKWTMCSSQ